MQQLLPPGAEHVDVHEFYARDWIGTGGVRANFIASADGGISVDGLSRGLQSPGDNTVFAALRDLADVVLVGAGTADAEGYRPARPSAERLAKRRRFGRRDALPIAIVSKSLSIPEESQLLTEPSTIVITCEASDAGRRAKLRTDVIVAGAEEVDLEAALSELAARGHRHVLCEGGPHLFGTLVDAGLLDELCLSVAAILAGPGAGRLSAGPPWTHGPRRLRLAGLLEEDDALFCRYRLSD